MACPHVSGAAAVLLSNSDLGAAGITSVLLGQATPDTLTQLPASTPNLMLKVSMDIPAPTPPPPPTPAPASGSWEITGTGCQLADGGQCITSKNFPAQYGNDESCTVVIHGSV